MDRITLSDGEWKLMNLLWDRAPRTIGEMVEALRGETDWTKATVNIMLNRLAAKGAVRIEAGGRAKAFYPLLERENAVVQEAKQCLAKIRTDGMRLLVSTMAESCALSEAEIEELYRILKEGGRHG